MVKFKLLEARKRKSYTQEYIADALFMDVSSYSRRENGQIKISIKEWQKLAEILETPLDQIYETDDQAFFITQDNSKGIGNSVFGNINNEIPKYIERYIEKLEQEVQELKEKLNNTGTK